MCSNAKKPAILLLGTVKVRHVENMNTCKSSASDSNPPDSFRTSSLGFRMFLALVFFTLTLNPVSATPAPTAPEAPPPSTPREFFNAGTRQLREGKFREAEAFFESTLASQEPRLQPPALYNLGHVRFDQGVEELKKGPAPRSAAATARRAEGSADEAIRKADEALAGDDLEKLVAAYIHGRGARKEAKAAAQAVRRAMEAHGAGLAKWERASGDFKGALELKTKDADARHNSEVVDRCIARLVDSLRELQKCSGSLGAKGAALGEKLKQLKGRIPATQAPPGAAGDDDEDDEESPAGLQPGQKEGPSKDGKEMMLSPEQAGWFLEGFKLDSDRRLPMGQGAEAQPKDRLRPTW